MHLQGNLETVHPQGSFMETKQCWNSHDTVYLALKKKKNPPYSK